MGPFREGKEVLERCCAEDCDRDDSLEAVRDSGSIVAAMAMVECSESRSCSTMVLSPCRSDELSNQEQMASLTNTQKSKQP